MKRTYLILPLLIFSFSLWSQISKNMSLLGRMEYDVELSDIWGYTDESGKEYALVGLNNGTSIVDISDPRKPVEISFIAGGISFWKDIKTYKNRAFVTGEYQQGLQIIDLSNLPNPITPDQVRYWVPNTNQIGNSACHNLFIEEKTGIAYLSGCTAVDGGILMLDLQAENPQYIGKIDGPYSHDVYVRNDTVYSSDMFEGVLSIRDLTNKKSPILLANQRTPFQFTHNAWLSDDGNYIFTTDETNNAPVAAYDISDLSNIKQVNQFYPEGSRGTGLIPHNVHVKDDFLITSYYAAGVVITDASKPESLIQVGHYDTYEGPNNGFDGVWGVFPYFSSGLIVASDIENGLFIFQPNYVKAARFEGMLKDSISGEPISLVHIKGTYRGKVIIETQSDFRGDFKIGTAQGGLIEFEFSKPSYETKKISLQMVNGQIENSVVALVANGLSIKTSTPTGCNPHEISFSPFGKPVDEYRWTFEGGTPATSTQKNPTVSYAEKGIYDVSLIGISATDTFEIKQHNIINIKDIPVVDFSFERERLTYTFINHVENADSILWDFGDGTTSQEAHPIHKFSGKLPEAVSLTAYNECGIQQISKKLNPNVTTSLESIQALASFEISPNPFVHAAFISYEFHQLPKNPTLNLMDISGKSLATFPLSNTKGKFPLGNDLAKGVYFARITAAGQSSKVLKIVKTQ
jgi:choice-of-anchor B domain-containing protein